VIGNSRVIGNGEFIYILDALYQVHRPPKLTRGAIHLGMALMTIENNGPTLLDIAFPLLCTLETSGQGASSTTGPNDWPRLQRPENAMRAKIVSAPGGTSDKFSTKRTSLARRPSITVPRSP